MSYGKLLQETVGKLARQEHYVPPQPNNNPHSIGAKIHFLNQCLDKLYPGIKHNI